MINSPCRTCTDRVLRCHKTCERYAEYRNKIEAIAAKREQARRDNQHGKAMTIADIRNAYRKAGGKSVNIQSR